MDFTYWDRDTELLDRDLLEKGQLADLKRTLERGFQTDFYRKRFAETGISSRRAFS